MKPFSKDSGKGHGYERHKTKLGKIWHFLAHEDSVASFAVDALLVLLIGKFVALPLLGFALGTPFPLVAVVSSSMEHRADFEAWWSQQKAWYEGKNITKEEFLRFPQHNGFNKGDIFVVRGIALEDVRVGDIVVYTIPSRPDPIIHRVIGIAPDALVTKGDGNAGQLDFELSVHREQLKGIALYRVPYLGWFKVALVELKSAIARR